LLRAVVRLLLGGGLGRLLGFEEGFDGPIHQLAELTAGDDAIGVAAGAAAGAPEADETGAKGLNGFKN